VNSEKTQQSARIRADQVARLREIAEHVPGSSINRLVQKAVDQWLEIEGPVYLAAFKEVQRQLGSKRQAVSGHVYWSKDANLEEYPAMRPATPEQLAGLDVEHDEKGHISRVKVKA
jgi:hypothetical protein